MAVRPLVFVGLISYSLYLWHWPALVLGRYWKLTWQICKSYNTDIIAIILSILLAILTWWIVEKPIRHRRILGKRTQIFAAAALVTFLLGTSGSALWLSKGVPSRVPVQVYRFSEVAFETTDRIEMNVSDVRNLRFPELGGVEAKLPARVLVWGDSHAMAVLPVLDLLCKEYRVRGLVAAHSSTAPLLGYECSEPFSLGTDSAQFNDSVLSAIREIHIGNVLLVASWNGYPDRGEPGDVHRRVLATAKALSEAGVNCWIMKAVPHHEWNVPRKLASTAMFGGDVTALGRKVADLADSRIRQDELFRGAQEYGVAILDPVNLIVNRDGICSVIADGTPLYRDSHHLSVAGAMQLRPLFEPLFRQIRTQ